MAKPEEIAAKKEEDIGWSPPSKLLALLTVALSGQLLLGLSQELPLADAVLLPDRGLGSRRWQASPGS